MCRVYMCIVFFTFLATTLWSHRFHHKIFKLSLSRPWNSNLNCVSVVNFLRENPPPKVGRIFMGAKVTPQEQTFQWKDAEKKLRMYGLCRGCGISFLLLWFFGQKLQGLGCFVVFHGHGFFRHINQPVCVRLSGLIFINSVISRQT